MMFVNDQSTKEADDGISEPWPLKASLGTENWVTQLQNNPNPSMKSKRSSQFHRSFLVLSVMVALLLTSLRPFASAFSLRSLPSANRFLDTHRTAPNRQRITRFVAAPPENPTSTSGVEEQQEKKIPRKFVPYPFEVRRTTR